MSKEKIVSNLNIVAEIQLVYKNKVNPSLRPQIKQSQDAYRLFLHQWDKNKIDLVEQFKILLLNQANKVLGIYDVSSGGITGTVADPRIILAAAIKANAVSIVMAHNHPSGSTKPSRQDEDLTNKIQQAAKFHDIKLLDHLIICREEYFSFGDEGFL